MADVDRTSQKPQVRPTGWVDRGVRLWRGGVPEDVRAYVNRWRRRWDEGQVLREIRGGPSGHTRGPLIVSGFFGDSKGISEAARLTAEGLEGAGEPGRRIRRLLPQASASSVSLPICRRARRVHDKPRAGGLEGQGGNDEVLSCTSCMCQFELVLYANDITFRRSASRKKHTHGHLLS